MGLNLKRNQRDLQRKLEAFLKAKGVTSRNVYFQPPSNVRMKYPAIVYSVNRTNGQHADNQMYRNMIGYSVTVISKNSDEEFAMDIENEFPYSRFDRYYIEDNLAHYSFLVYN